MKMKCHILKMLVVFAAIPIFSNAQNLVIGTNSGYTAKAQLDSIQNLTFPGNNLVLKMEDNTTRSFNLLSLKKLYFEPATGYEFNEISGKKFNLQVYPNPAGSTIRIINAPQEMCVVYIFSVQGSYISSSCIYTSEHLLDITHLEKGVYFIKINNQVAKFVKL